MSELRVARDLTLPIELAGESTAILAKKGAGKSNTAKVLVEETLDHGGVQVLVLDPIGHWWSLRAGADGKPRGGYPVAVFGGMHGDLPLEETAGKLLAKTAVDSGQSIVLDVSGLDSNGAMQRFVYEFLEELYRLKQATPTPTLLVLEEADEFAPQDPKGKNVPRMVGAANRISKRGRGRGLGMLYVTQRSAALNKNVLDQADTLIVMRTMGPRDRAAIEGWVKHQDAAGMDEVLPSLPSLQTGEAWVWAPQRSLLKRVQIRKARTFDSSWTPKPGEAAIAAEVKPIDVDKLGAEIAATAERAKASGAAVSSSRMRASRSSLSRSSSRMRLRSSVGSGPGSDRRAAGALHGRRMTATLASRGLLAQVLAPSSLEREAVLYLAFKRKRLTAASQRGYRQTLREFAGCYFELQLEAFEPPAGTVLIEDFLTLRWGDAAPRTYNKNFSVLHDFFKWQLARGRLMRDPMLSLERARPRAIEHHTYSKAQRASLLAANPQPRDQVALRLLLDYGIRKGALRNVRFEHFDHVRRRLVIFTKGEKIHRIPIPDPAVWENLEELAEPAEHYLIPRQKIRKRISPDRPLFAEASDLLGDLAVVVGEVADQSCLVEKRRFEALLEDALALLGGMAESAAVQVRSWPAEPRGEHGLHLYWYRLLARAAIVPRGTTAGSRMHHARHTAGQRVLEATGNLKAAQMLLGHADIGTTAAHYTGWDDEQLDGSLRTTLGLPSVDADLLRRAAALAEQERTAR